MFRILVIEDSKVFSRALHLCLTDAGFSVECAMSGEDGLRSASLSPPNLILLDMFLPRLDGMMVLRMLNADPKTRGIPIVVLSGNPKKEDIDQAKKLGVVDYFVKDAMPAERLVALIKQVASAQSLVT